jgi:hypothetical protein
MLWWSHRRPETITDAKWPHSGQHKKSPRHRTMTEPLPDTPEFYRSRAENARGQAENMLDEVCKRIMFSIVDSYEEMACQAEERRRVVRYLR